jgi:hypothetical protein
MTGNGIALLGIRVRVIRTIIRRIWFPSRKLYRYWHGISLSRCEPPDEQLKTRHSGTWLLWNSLAIWLQFQYLADLAMRGFAISFLTLARVTSPNSFLAFFFIAHP